MTSMRGLWLRRRCCCFSRSKQSARANIRLVQSDERATGSGIQELPTRQRAPNVMKGLLMCRRRVLILCVLSLVLPLAAPAAAQVAAPAPAPALDNAARREIVEAFARAMQEHYIFPDQAEQVAQRANGALASGKYDDARTAGELAGRLSAEASAVTHDKHLNVFSVQEPQQPRSTEAPPRMPAAEAGVARADRLTGGVGYIEVIGFPPVISSKRVVDRAMASLSGSRALIIDVRRNGGGDPESVAYLVSFLIPPGRAINDIISRVAKTTETTRQSYRSVRTPVSFFDIPVYVLTSKATFSGGEEFAYDVQALKRGMLIGETTGGGANPVGPVDIGHGVVALIPFGRAENPITKTNWEGSGVRPDVSVVAEAALATALVKAGSKPHADVATASTKTVFSPRTTQLPGSDAAARRIVDAIASGNTIQDIVTPQLASEILPEITKLRAELANLGRLLAVNFWRPHPFFGDEFKLTFANGRRKTVVSLDDQGKIAGMLPLAPLAPGE